MVVGDFDVGGVAVTPDDAHAELVVHPDGMLAVAIAFEGFQPVGGRDAERVERDSRVQHGELTLRHSHGGLPENLYLIVPLQIASVCLSLKLRIINLPPC